MGKKNLIEQSFEARSAKCSLCFKTSVLIKIIVEKVCGVGANKIVSSLYMALLNS
ncbi:uncharacterized protein PHALS_02672 [Plasmopara halstedii]|uniref:Uncharacterized protein n=1 Tax=Plasmopara halstedii TaxID=4781 RepID=A0A0P1AXK7_PLAHL|nr:uncharacterized protein PHALS_02672 [Plasmopara halstedii]CEG46261.1 hypothetical protein PHALS_02672 [Plasmopara halstedii]|eukprot:XP_024582630.1 hypothetical protein PHALS_02672 [Plasmopara halstedii]